MKITGIACGTIIAVLASCQSDVQMSDGKDVVGNAIAKFSEEGLTCENQAVILNLSNQDAARFQENVQQNFSPEELGQFVKSRAKQCGVTQQQPPADATQKGTSAVTGTHLVEIIEKASGSGGVSPAIYRDSSSSTWMCNSGSPENPADFIGQYHVGGAYANHANLRVRSTNVWSDCYIQANNSARVYSDDDVRMCIGYWHVFFCGASVPLPEDTYMWD